MIIIDPKKTLPKTWTDGEIIDLFEHARELGHNGNPAGYFLSRDLHPYVGYSDEQGHHLKAHSEWDYDNIRGWINGHQEQVLRVLKFRVTGWW